MNHRLFLVTGLLLLTLPLASFAQGERVQIGQDIVIEVEEAASEAVCIGCSIRVLGQVSGDVVAIGGNIEIEGSAGQDVVAVFGNLAINGSVGQDAVAVSGNVRLGSSAQVGQDVVSSGGRVERDSQASVGGKITSAPGVPVVGTGLMGLVFLALVVCGIVNLVLVLLCYLLAGEQRVDTMVATLRERAGLAFLTGLGVAVGVILLFIFAATLGPLTPIVVIVVALAFLLTLLIGYTGLSSWLGRSLARKTSPLWAVLLGAVLVTILQLIPLVGLLLFLVFFPLSLGIAALSGYGTAPNWLAERFGQ
jgi:hypothetical protein